MSLSQEHKADTTPAVSSFQQLSELTGRDYFDTWLATQCRLIIGTYFGVLVERKEGSENYQPVSIWPESAADMDTVSELIEQVIDQECGLITELDKVKGDNRFRYALAFPVIIDGKVKSIVAINVNIDDRNMLKFAMQQLQWGCAWIELKEKKDLAKVNGLIKSELGRSIDILARILSENSSSAANLRFVTELALLFSCERASIGFINNKLIRIDQVSHSSHFGQKMNLVRLIESAMEESADQAKPVVLPVIDPSANTITIAHQALVDQENLTSIMTFPLFINHMAAGAVTLERSTGSDFSGEDLKYCESIGALVVSVLIEKKQNDRSIYLKIIDSVRNLTIRIFGPGHHLLKYSLVLLVFVCLFFVFATGNYRLSADATLKGALLRAVVAPYDGYIDTALVRAGDTVSKNETLLNLDVRDFHLEKLRLHSQLEKLKSQHQEALAGYDRAGQKIISAQLEQAEIQLQLVEMLFERAVLKAPFDGIVVSGDLSQRLGGAVTQGELLFEISPKDEYRVDLKVKESRIADVMIGQTGRIYLSAIPEKPYKFTVSRIIPTTIAEDGESYFIVEAELENIDRDLQIGMEGVAQIDVDKRKLVSIWTRDLIDWLRLQFWSL